MQSDRMEADTGAKESANLFGGGGRGFTELVVELGLEG